MNPSESRHRKRRGRLKTFTLIAAILVLLAVGPASSETRLADTRERTTAEHEARTAKRKERARREGRRDGSQSAEDTSAAVGRGDRPPALRIERHAPASRTGSAPIPMPRRDAPPRPVPGPANPPAPTAPPDATNDAVVEAARARAEQMQALSETHARETAEDARRFQERMRSATTPAERTALQQEFQREGARKAERFQEQMRALRQH